MATSRDPDLRPASAGQFLRAIQEVQDRLVPGTAPYYAPAGNDHAAFGGALPAQPGPSAFQGSASHPSLPLHSGSGPLWASGPDSASDSYRVPGTRPGSGPPGNAPGGVGPHDVAGSEDHRRAIAGHD